MGGVIVWRRANLGVGCIKEVGVERKFRRVFRIAPCQNIHIPHEKASGPFYSDQKVLKLQLSDFISGISRNCYIISGMSYNRDFLTSFSTKRAENFI